MDYAFTGKVSAAAGVVTLEIETLIWGETIHIINGNGAAIPTNSQECKVTAQFEVQNSHFFVIGESPELTDPVRARYAVKEDTVIDTEAVIYLDGAKFE